MIVYIFRIEQIHQTENLISIIELHAIVILISGLEYLSILNIQFLNVSEFSKMFLHQIIELN